MVSSHDPKLIMVVQAQRVSGGRVCIQPARQRGAACSLVVLVIIVPALAGPAATKELRRRRLQGTPPSGKRTLAMATVVAVAVAGRHQEAASRWRVAQLAQP
ncbi:hypothetical protein P7K49_033489 [Saguinus oedipus]|uniref:Uncharacterized protein n=1 Tax=Saguinus oedipus TaxID=9490 RepID=A0ABQ9TS36_SAGOE|nr:hypothetical protein P7K49_033489 [Saguinus oedipus]